MAFNIGFIFNPFINFNYIYLSINKINLILIDYKSFFFNKKYFFYNYH